MEAISISPVRVYLDWLGRQVQIAKREYEQAVENKKDFSDNPLDAMELNIAVAMALNTYETLANAETKLLNVLQGWNIPLDKLTSEV